MTVVSNFSMFIIALVLALGITTASGKSFLVERKSSFRKVDSAAFNRDLSNAIGEALGCGGHLDQKDLDSIEQWLTPIWNSLPKNTAGRIEPRSLRYLTYRYFNQRFAIVPRGFEPSRPVNQSGWPEEDILSQRMPAYVESVLASRHAQEHGFDLKDVVYVVATLQELIFDSESTLLEKVYKQQIKRVDRPLSRQGLGQVLESYLVHWMMGNDPQGIRILLRNRSLLESTFPAWNQLVEFAHGQVRAMEYKRQKTSMTTKANHENALSSHFSFDDGHQVVGDITKSFANFWESESSSMKASLVQMDTHHTGRVPLSRFYSSALDSEWRFGESESYLRELGALDETSSWRGKQVIIPNYIQAASNCIVSTDHYMVCCINDCESILGDIEAKIGGPMASSGELLSVVGNMSSISQTTLEEDKPLELAGSLAGQLEQIAAANGGQVTLHGRLFAQWLHYAFPRECPFPHKVGIAAAVTPLEYGGKYIATEEEMKKHAAAVNASDIPAEVRKEEMEWMSQWSSDEELIYNDSLLRAPWERSSLAWGSAILFVIAALLGIVGLSWKASPGTSACLLPTYGTSKSHFV